MDNLLKKINDNREKRKIYGILLLIFSLILFQVSNFIFIGIITFHNIFGVIGIVFAFIIFICGLYIIFYIPIVKEDSL